MRLSGDNQAFTAITEFLEILTARLASPDGAADWRLNAFELRLLFCFCSKANALNRWELPALPAQLCPTLTPEVDDFDPTYFLLCLWVLQVWVHETAVQGDGGVTLLAELHYVAKNPKSLLQTLILQK